MNDASPETSPAWVRNLRSIAEEDEKEWVAMRRHLHQHPELSGDERRTTEFIASAISKLELPTWIAGSGLGLTADFVSSPAMANHARLAIRGDIDGLPIHDHKSVAYRSLHDGVMHACGHDVHATIVFAAMHLLVEMQRRDQLPWPVAVRCIFQPSEELATGARQMIHEHVLRNVEGILALHVDPNFSVGSVGLRPGTLTAFADMFHVKFEGRGGHGARPHLCKDPIDAATRWVQSAYRCISRTVNPHKTVVISVGRLHAGHSANVIPETAELYGSLRSLEPDGRRVALEMLEDVCEAVQRETGCKIDLRLDVAAPAVVNDPAFIQLLADAATQTIDPGAVSFIEEPSMGSEDFSYYLEKVPGAMFRLGIAGDQVGHEPLHTPTFDVDERALLVGAKLFAAATIRYFDPERTRQNLT